MKAGSHAAHMAARNIEDATDGAPEATKPTRAAPDKYTLAAKLARRLEQLRRDTDAELLTTPQTIEARYEAKRKKLMAEAAREVIACLPNAVLRAEDLGAEPKTEAKP